MGTSDGPKWGRAFLTHMVRTRGGEADCLLGIQVPCAAAAIRERLLTIGVKRIALHLASVSILPGK